MNPYTLEHIFSCRGAFASPPEVIGEMPEGIRVNFYSTRGESLICRSNFFATTVLNQSLRSSE